MSSPSNMKSAAKPTTIKKSTESNKTDKKKQPTKQNPTEEKPDEVQVKSEKTIQEQPQPTKPKVRFKDTTVIEMEPIYAIKKQPNNEKNERTNPIIIEIENANNLLEKGDVQKAKEKFAIIYSTLPYGDSLYYEARFGEIECIIALKDIMMAKKLLEELLEDKYLNSETEEKTLVRLGQIECVLSNPNTAENYFNKLKSKYPRSIYIKVANCNFLKKK